jgi:membrane protein DedA with SNARE-associated domain
LPPPMPFKIFVATAGALEYPRWRFMLTVMIARSVRYIIEGTLAVFYGERVLVFMKDNGLYILSGVGALLVVGVGVYVLVKHIRTPRRSMVEVVEEAKREGKIEAKLEGKAAD